MTHMRSGRHKSTLKVSARKWTPKVNAQKWTFKWTLIVNDQEYTPKAEWRCIKLNGPRTNLQNGRSFENNLKDQEQQSNMTDSSCTFARALSDL